MIKEAVKLKGSLQILVLDENNQVKDSRNINNLVVSVGKNYIADRMLSNTSVVMSHMAIGSGNVAPTVSDTTLNTETARVVLSSATRISNVVTYTATYAAGVGTGTISEAGVFNSGSTGTMLCRTNFNEVNKSAPDVIVITWNVTVE